MFIRIGYDISLRLAVDTSVLFCLKVHPDREHDLLADEQFYCNAISPGFEYIDGYGNRCGRARSLAGILQFRNTAIVKDSGELDLYEPNAPQHDISELPPETLQFLLPSRYCDADSELLNFAWATFGSSPLGWGRVQAICDFVHQHLRFDYLLARATRTASQGFQEKVGVCRDFTHLAITLCRCMNIPARYATGYLGDIGIPACADPMDFSAWFEVFLGGRWFTFDARHNRRRIGRIVMARGRDATDAALTTVFGNHTLEHFEVVCEEIPESAIPPEVFAIAQANGKIGAVDGILPVPLNYRRPLRRNAR